MILSVTTISFYLLHLEERKSREKSVTKIGKVTHPKCKNELSASEEWEDVKGRNLSNSRMKRIWLRFYCPYAWTTYMYNNDNYPIPMPIKWRDSPAFDACGEQKMHDECSKQTNKQTNRTRSYLTNFIHHIILVLWWVCDSPVNVSVRWRNKTAGNISFALNLVSRMRADWQAVCRSTAPMHTLGLLMCVCIVLCFFLRTIFFVVGSFYCHSLYFIYLFHLFYFLFSSFIFISKILFLSFSLFY